FEWKDNDMQVYGEDGDGDEESNSELGDSCNEDKEDGHDEEDVRYNRPVEDSGILVCNYF
ncbi:hypothetical protein Tco_1475565, partial [Tanacetum coccineum]